MIKVLVISKLPKKTKDINRDTKNRRNRKINKNKRDNLIRFRTK